MQENVTRKDVTQEILDEKCPQCGEVLVIRLGRHGRFIGCSTYPQCDYTRDVNGDAQANTAELLENRFCPECNEPLVVKTGRYGKFIGCSKYPDCTYIEPLNKPVDTGVQCPQCRNGRMLERRSRSGKIFYSCSTYPKCNYAVWNMPLAEACPQCGWPILTIKTTKRRGTEKVCPQKHCDFHEAVEMEEEGVT